jgi:hypothetical protein
MRAYIEQRATMKRPPQYESQLGWLDSKAVLKQTMHNSQSLVQRHFVTPFSYHRPPAMAQSSQVVVPGGDGRHNLLTGLASACN